MKHQRPDGFRVSFYVVAVMIATSAAGALVSYRTIDPAAEPGDTASSAWTTPVCDRNGDGVGFWVCLANTLPFFRSEHDHDRQIVWRLGQDPSGRSGPASRP